MTPFVNQILSRDRLKAILSMFHISDNSMYILVVQPNHDTLHKVRPQYEHLQEKFETAYTPNKNIAIDEAMCSWRGQLRFRFYPRDKPIPWRVKLYELCESGSDYVHCFEIYAGDSTISNKRTNVVLRLIESLLNKGFHIFTDNYNTCSALYQTLSKRKTMCTGTVRSNRKVAGVPPDKLVEAHGTFVTASCVACHERHRGSEIKDAIFDDKIPHCKKSGCYGIVKPDIVFFGEELPKRFYFYLKDMLQTDLVIVMGTSLEVQPFAGIIDTVRWSVPRLLFNRNAVGPFKHGKRAKDFISEGDLIECLQDFVNLSGMKEDMVDLITRSEGTFRLFAPPPPESAQAKPARKINSINKTDPLLAAMWRQNARANLFSDSDSSDSSDLSESESESTSSSGKHPMNSKVPSLNRGSKPSSVQSSPARTPKPIKPTNNKSSLQNGASSSRPPSGKGPLGSGRAVGGNHSNNSSNGTGQTRNYTSLLSRRKAVTPPIQPRRLNASPSRMQNSDSSWTGNMVRKRPPIEATLGLSRKPPQSPGSHPMKPRSNSVNKAMPERAHSNKVGGFRAVIDRVRSAKPAPRFTYQHRPNPKTSYDARIMTLNAATSSSSDDDDDDDREDIDDSSSSSDSR
ncbi:NAD-dependent protein deacetylase sirtuin-3-like [Plakobranchus ocellatus]|uniref:NAD-dependent protein deacetylase sirtuin-3-like n=1 Tax=Plakobranchus ocellatus TaxID=259542 RepID=A0AAV4C5H1_9GAST|nr:NAD-dependent protein deacetylase sirtuin-3-like [Plakobranchus ocellatus]